MKSLLAMRASPILAVVAALGLAWAGPAAADADQVLTVTPSPAGAPALGTVIRGASATTFAITPDGTVTRVSGDAIRLSNAGVTAPTVSIRCSPKCNGQPLRVTIRPGGGSSEAGIVGLSLGPVSGAHMIGAPPAPGPVLVFEIRMVGETGEAVFPLGMDVRLAAGAQSLTHAFSYVVTVEPE